MKFIMWDLDNYQECHILHELLVDNSMISSNFSWLDF